MKQNVAKFFLVLFVLAFMTSSMAYPQLDQPTTGDAAAPDSLGATDPAYDPSAASPDASGLPGGYPADSAATPDQLPQDTAAYDPNAQPAYDPSSYGQPSYGYGAEPQYDPNSYAQPSYGAEPQYEPYGAQPYYSSEPASQ